MGQVTDGRAARRRAARMQRLLERAWTRAERQTPLAGATTPKAALYRVLRTLECNEGAESGVAKLARHRMRVLMAEIDRQEAAYRRSFKGRWAALLAWVTGMFTRGAPALTSGDLDAAGVAPKSAYPDPGFTNTDQARAERGTL